MDVAELVRDLVRRDALTGATLSGPRKADPSRPTRVTVEPVRVRGGVRYRFRAHEAARTHDENLAPETAGERIVALLEHDFRQGLLHAEDADWQVLAGGKGEPKVLRRPATRPAATREHDRRKHRPLLEGEPVPFLVELGVTTREGVPRAKRQDKLRQVGRFLELVDDVLDRLPADGALRVVDFGSGRSYLTFALHHLLTAVRGREVELLGLDVKPDVVAECEALARKLDARGLRFEVGDIATHDLAGIDLVVSLHACDTATDAALDRAVRAGATVILAVPCCQHELLGQISSDALRPLLRHGTLRERLAAEVTDAARAQLLRLAGYDVQVVEFVELEHTPKNVLLRAVRLVTPRTAAQQARIAAEYRTFADALAIEPALERLLAERLEPRP